uniref:Uncharacterized protein n=1 Tax=Picea sitchensis TaxID=3332 RepID=A9NJV6_PICSI|nr:unknown [Picea sitchensis]
MHKLKSPRLWLSPPSSWLCSNTTTPRPIGPSPFSCTCLFSWSLWNVFDKNSS